MMMKRWMTVWTVCAAATAVCGMDWTAKWIGPNAATRPDFDMGGAQWIREVGTQQTVRVSFDLAGKPTSAVRMALTCKPRGRVFVNGAEVFNEWGAFHKWEPLRYIDIAPQLKAGPNEIAVELDHKRPAKMADRGLVMRVDLPDGRTVVSDGTWQDALVLSETEQKDFSSKLIRRHELCSPAFEKTFEVLRSTDLVRASLAITAPGFYEASINGARVGDRVLDPTPSQYDKHVFYTVYDVKNMLAKGENTIKVLLGHGWYDCRSVAVWNIDQAPWRDFPRMIAQLDLEYADGTTARVISNGSWKQVPSPVAFDDLRECEIVGDVRRPGAPDLAAHPLPAAEVAGPKGALVEQKNPGSKVDFEVKPVTIEKLSDGAYVVDFGIDIAGWVRLEAPGQKKGDVVVIQYDERREGACLTGDRAVNQHFRYPASFETVGFRTGFACDKLVCSGKNDVYEPRFTYNGFRFVRLEGLAQAPSADTLRAKSIRTAFPETGSIETSEPAFNQLLAMCDRAYKSNFADGFPTDCPHREKNGWTGDAALASELAQYKFDNTAAYLDWMISVCDAQASDGKLPGVIPTSGWGYDWCSGPTWDVALWEIPKNIYLYKGDDRGIRIVYPTLKRYLDTTFARRNTGAENPALKGLVTWGLHDWIPAKSYTSRDYLATAYLVNGLDTAILFARAIGREDDVPAYAMMAAELRKVLRERFMKADGTWAEGTQTAQAVALQFALYDGAAERKAAEAKLVEAVERANRHSDFGILGSKHVFRALSEAGRTDLAWEMLNQKTAPSFMTWAAKGGTALWEDWGDGWSRNHVMFGDFVAWAYQYLAGIRLDPAAPAGSARYIVDPKPIAGLDYVKARVETPHGTIVSEWKRRADVTVETHIENPTWVSYAKCAWWQCGEEPKIAAAGYDYSEANVGLFFIPDQDDAAWAKQKEKILALGGAPYIAANGFIPWQLKITGPEGTTKVPEALAYAERACRRADEVGVKYIVFGSGGARKIPDGFDPAENRRQFVAFCQALAARIADCRVTIVLEPLNSKECNFLNSVSEGADLVDEIASPRVQLLADFYHMAQDKESPDSILKAGKRLRHVHIAMPVTRSYPGDGEGTLKPYFDALKKIGYRGIVSAECGWGGPGTIEEKLAVALKTAREWAK